MRDLSQLGSSDILTLEECAVMDKLLQDWMDEAWRVAWKLATENYTAFEVSENIQ